MVQLWKKIDEQKLAWLTQDLENQLAQQNSITKYRKLKSTKEELADLFADESYAQRNTKEWLLHTKAILEKVIADRIAKWWALPQYIAAMQKDLEIINYRLQHLEVLHNDTTFSLQHTNPANSLLGTISLDALFTHNAQDISRHGIEIDTTSLYIGNKAVKVKGNVSGAVIVQDGMKLLCEVDGTPFVLSCTQNWLHIDPSTILMDNDFTCTMTWVYGKKEWDAIVWRVWQEKNIVIQASEQDKKSYKEKDDAHTINAIKDIDNVQDISTKTISDFVNNDAAIFVCINDVFSQHNATKLYWKYLDANQKKMFIDWLLRSQLWFTKQSFPAHDTMKQVFFDAIIAYKNSSKQPKTTEQMTDLFVWFDKHQDIKVAVHSALQEYMTQHFAKSTTQELWGQLAIFYKKYNNKPVNEFDVFYTKLETDQSWVFEKIKEEFEVIKQDTMVESFVTAMYNNHHVQQEKINNEMIRDNIAWHNQQRFAMQMVFQQDAWSQFPSWNRMQYIPTLHHTKILTLETFLESFKNEIEQLSKQETNPEKLWWTIKTLIMHKLSDREVKKTLQDKLYKIFADKISQNISWWTTNVLNEMNKFAIDAKAYQPWLRKAIDTNNKNTDTPSDQIKISPLHDKLTTKDDFEIQEYNDDNMTMSAVISDVSRVYAEQAEHIWDEAVRKQYTDLWKITWKDANPLRGDTYKKMFKRMWLYFFRQTRKEKIAQEEMKKLQTNWVDMHRSELTAAADRHERMYRDQVWNSQKNEDDRIDWVVEQVNDSRIDDLCREYLDHPQWMDDRDFENKFNQLVATTPGIVDAMKDNKMNHTASNILLKLRTQRTHNTMMNWVMNALLQYADTQNINTYKNTDIYTNAVKELVSTYIKNTHHALSPNLQKVLTAPGEQLQQYMRWVWHEIGLAKMQAKTLKIKLDVLVWGKWAYEVNNRDKNKNFFARVGRKLDKYPNTALALSVWSTLAVGIMNPAWAWAFAVVKWAWWLISKKAAHYTKEQKAQEDKLVRGLDSEKNRLQNLRSVAENASRWQKVALWTNAYKWVRQWQLYANTIQFEFMNDAKKDLAMLEQHIVSLDMSTLRSTVGNALARLDYYAVSGHNFLWQQDDKQMEETINALQKLTYSGAATLGKTIEEMRQDASYWDMYTALDTQYRTLRRKFRKQRTILWVKYGLAAATFAVWARWLLGTHDVNKAVYDDGGVSWTWWVWTSPNQPPSSSIPSHQTPWVDIYDPNFDVDHHGLFDPENGYAAFGMDPETVYAHCGDLNVLDATMQENIMNHMIATQEIAFEDVRRVLEWVRQVVEEHTAPDPAMQEKVAAYLYHFTERDSVLSNIIEKWWDALKDTITDWGSGRWAWLDGFMHGGEYLARTLWNIVATSSPLFANTFLENPQVKPRDKKSWFGGFSNTPLYSQSYNTVVDPNKQKISSWYIDDNALNWIIRAWQNQQQSSQDVVSSQPIVESSPQVNIVDRSSDISQDDDSNDILPTLDNDIQQAQKQIDNQEKDKQDAEKFLLLLQPKVDVLTRKYKTYIFNVYSDILEQFEEAKQESDASRKLQQLTTIKFKVIELQKSIQSIKIDADDTFASFAEQYKILPQWVQNRVAPAMKELQSLRRQSQQSIMQLWTYITTLDNALQEVQTIIQNASNAQNTVSNTWETQEVSLSNQTTKWVQKQNLTKATKEKNTVQKSNVKKDSVSGTPNKNTASSLSSQESKKKPNEPMKILERINEIRHPIMWKANPEKYYNAVETVYKKYWSIISVLTDIQRDLRNDAEILHKKQQAWETIDPSIIQDIQERNTYFWERLDALESRLTQFVEETDKYLDNAKDDHAKIIQLKEAIVWRWYNNLIDYAEKIDSYVDDLIKNITSIQPTISNQSSQQIDSTSQPIVSNNMSEKDINSITLDNMITMFTNRQDTDALRIKKKGNQQLFADIKNFINANPNSVNAIVTNQEISIIGIANNDTWLWVKPWS